MWKLSKNTAVMKTETEKLNDQIGILKDEGEFKTGLLSLISHDFKEVFGSLLWLTEAVENGSITKDDFFKLLPRINQDAKKNLQTLSDIGAWLGTQKDQFEPKNSNISVLELFLHLQEEFEDKLHEKKIYFDFKKDENLFFQGDSVLISYALNKILDNAIRYSSEGKIIFLKASETNTTINLSITDQGIGMNSETQKSIFMFQGPVFKATDGQIGAGLSLKIAKYFVSLMQGKIVVDSTENVGTEISIILPKIKK